MSSRRFAFTLLAAAFVFLAPAGGGGAGEPSPITRASERSAVELAKERFQHRYTVAYGEIEVLGALPVEWPDTGLGCPEPGTMVSPVVVPGHAVVIRHDGGLLSVNTGGGRALLCDRLPPPLGALDAASVPAVLRLYLGAREDLAARLGVDAEGISLRSAAARTWNDGSLGCPRRGEDYTQAIVEGFELELEAGGEAHRYHTGSEQVVYCPPA